MSTIPNSAQLFPQAVSIQSPEGDLAKISPYGAHVLSWVPAAGQERLFLSSKAEFRFGAAIRGGVPVIFPQFASQGRLPKHGFARTALWEMARVNADSAVFWLSETPETYQIWPHRFLVEYRLRISRNKLEMTLSITNTDITPFAFTAALHSYLQVQDVRSAAVQGLQGSHYRDSANAGQTAQEQAPQVTFSGEIDRIYQNAPSVLKLVDAERILSIHASGFPDAVIWNPGVEKCAALPDMEAQGYQQFVCVESAVSARPVRLLPGENWLGTQTLIV
jgi:glucose-6-phosphate 1-epimerase